MTLLRGLKTRVEGDGGGSYAVSAGGTDQSFDSTQHVETCGDRDTVGYLPEVAVSKVEVGSRGGSEEVASADEAHSCCWGSTSACLRRLRTTSSRGSSVRPMKMYRVSSSSHRVGLDAPESPIKETRVGNEMFCC